MLLQLWPREEELGGYFLTFMKMMMCYATIAEIFEGEDWLLQVESHAHRLAIQADGVMDVLVFVEIFYTNLANHNFQVYMIVRPFFHSIF